MNKTYHFIAGLPRSGSTLLTAIFNQNENFYSNITDQLFNCFENVMINIYSKYTPMLIKEENVRQMILGMFDGFYNDVDKQVIFNTHRCWPKYTEYLHKIDPKFKIICCVRNYNDILNSLEKVYKSRRLSDPINTVMYDGMINTVWHRTEHLANQGFVRVAYDILKEAYYGPHKKHLFFVEYKDLVCNTKETVKKVYDFIEQPYYEHDFDNVSYSNPEYDDKLHAPGLHNVRNKIEYLKSEIVIPPELRDRYAGWEFWR